MREEYFWYPGHDQLADKNFPYQPCDMKGNYICVLWSGCDVEAGYKTANEFFAADFKVWYDTTPSSDSVWTDEIEYAIAGSRAVVLLYSSQAYQTHYFWQCCKYTELLKIPLFILHLEEMSDYRVLERQKLVEEVWVDPFAETFPEKLRISRMRYFLSGEAAQNKRDKYDLGTRFFMPYGQGDSEFIVNLRTHETWDKDGRPCRPVNSEELDFLRDKIGVYRLLPRSVASDYTETTEDKYFTSRQIIDIEKRVREEKERLRREELEAKRRQEEKEEEKRRRGFSPFSEDYPYMDEFEYINSDKRG